MLMTATEELAGLMALLTNRQLIDKRVYPELADATNQERFRFFIRHSALHFTKTAGKIATEAEHADHGEPIDMEKLRTNLVKGLVNVLLLARILDISAEELVQGIKEM